MAKRIPFKDRPALIRNPADWAREWGWISPKKAANDAAALRQLAHIIRGALDGDEMAEMWAEECERVAKRLDPAPKVARLKAKWVRLDKVAAMREP